MKRIMKLLATLFAFTTVCLACGGNRGFESLSPDDFSMLLHNGNIQLVDVRTGLEYSESHIPGAINMNVMDDSFTVHVDSVLQKDIPVAVYCRSGKRSKKAASILVERGFKVFDLDNGLIGWEKAGKEIDK